VNDAFLVRCGQPRSDLLGQIQRFLDRQGAALQEASEVRSLDELGGEETDAVRLPHIVERHDVWVVESGRGAGFHLETPQSLRFLSEIRRQYLDRNFAPEPRIPCAVDLPHAAPAERREDFVRAEAAPRGKSHPSATRRVTGDRNRIQPVSGSVRAAIGMTPG
jgi:hypothetical protein